MICQHLLPPGCYVRQQAGEETVPVYLLSCRSSPRDSVAADPRLRPSQASQSPQHPAMRNASAVEAATLHKSFRERYRGPVNCVTRRWTSPTTGMLAATCIPRHRHTSRCQCDGNG